MRAVVVGAGVAGFEAAAELRRASADAEIAIVTEENAPFYARIRLPEVVAGRTPPEKIVLKGPAWFAEQRITLRTGTRVEGVDAAGGTVQTAGGERIPYDALLLATGARSFVPPIPGADLPGVVTLRTMADALDLRERARAGGPVVVIGGGLLGIELAAGLRGAGVDVTVVEMAPWLLNRQLDAGAADVLREVIERKGIRLRLGARIERIDGADTAGAVVLGDGERLPAAFVAISAGVRPDTTLARLAGADVDKGIRVDDALRTSVPGIWAAGDCTEHRGRLYGIWPASEAQGRAAGASMAGNPVAYEGTVVQTTLKVTDVLAFSIGRIGADTVAETTRTGDAYRGLFRDGEGRLVGAVLVGDLKERRAVTAAVSGGLAYP